MLYILAAWGSVEPEILGPFKTENQRIRAAIKYKADNGEESAVFRLDVNEKGIPSTSSFTNSEME